MAFCGNCGKKIEQDVQNCPYCGTRNPAYNATVIRDSAPAEENDTTANREEQFVYVCPDCLDTVLAQKERRVSCPKCQIDMICSDYSERAWISLSDVRRESCKGSIRLQQLQKDDSGSVPHAAQSYKTSTRGWIGILRGMTLIYIIAGIIGSFSFAYTVFKYAVEEPFFIGLFGSIITLTIGAAVMVFLDQADDIREIKNMLKRWK